MTLGNFLGSNPTSEIAVEFQNKILKILFGLSLLIL